MMPLEEKFQKLVESMTVGFNRMTQVSGEVFNNQSKTSYDKETAKSFKYADLTYKICKTLKDRVEAMITPNPARRIGKKIKDEFKLAVLEDLQKSEKLAVVTKESAYDLPGTDLSVTLSHYPSVYEDMGESEREFAIKVQSGLLSVINDFLNSYWPELQEERRKLDLLRIDYDWARNGRWNKVDESKVAKAKEEFDHQLYRIQLLLKQCEVTREKVESGLKEMAIAQLQHFMRCVEIMQRLNAVLNKNDFE